MTSESAHPILIGCCTWSYADWEGPLFPEGLSTSEYLGYYADRFPIVEVDSTFYGLPSPGAVRGWARRTPEHFRFALKVPQVITHQKRLRNCAEDVERFVDAALLLGPKLHSGLLQMGYFNREAFASFEEFLPILDEFLAAWPHDKVPLAVETRNPRWVVPEFAEALRKHGAALTLTAQKWMPTPAKIVAVMDPVTAPFSFVRLMGDREYIERVTTTWNRVVLDRSAELDETASVIRSVAERVPVVVFVSNHFAGCAPETVRQLRRILGQPDPVPPERPRTTLFD